LKTTYPAESIYTRCTLHCNKSSTRVSLSNI